MVYSGRVVPWPRGRVLGGTSAINGLLYVRGQSHDFDMWRQLGNAGWSFADELPEDLTKPSSLGRRLMADVFGDRNYLRYFVTADSFEAYIKARQMAEKIQIPVGWIFADPTARQDMSLGERKITATPDPNWTPPPPGPKPPPQKKKPVEDILD